MPHDMNGAELKVGATVLVPCQVKAIHLTEQYCNIDLETNISMYPTNNKTSFVLNSRQTIRKSVADEMELLRAARVIVDQVCKNSGSINSVVADLAFDLMPKLNQVLDQ